MKGFRSRALLAAALTIGLLVSPNAAQTVTAVPAMPAVMPVGLPMPAAVAVERKAKLTLNPAADTIVVSFGKSYSRRWATLQKLPTVEEGATPAEWLKAASKKRLDSKGRVTFKTDVLIGFSYRVSLSKSGSHPAKLSRALTLDDQWDAELRDGFDNDINKTNWFDRGVGAQMRSRLCSLPSNNPELRSVDEGKFAAGIIKHKGGEFFENVVARANPIAKEKLAQDLVSAQLLRTQRKRNTAIAQAKYRFKITYNCPQGAFENTMVSSIGAKSGLRVNTAEPGIVSARVKFPAAQGMHSAMWLQSYSPGGGEIDIIEGFGYGDGVINMIHVPSTGKMYKPGDPSALKKTGGRVLESKTRSRKWWDAYHEVSVEWTTSKFVFRVDGTVTKTMKLKPGNVDYFLILSLLSSDWELPRLARPIGKVAPIADLSTQKFMVDWVRIWSKNS